MLWLMWELIIFRVLFKLNRPGLWPNDPVRGHKYIRRWSTKVEVEITSQEELKGIYNRSKPIQVKSHLRTFIRDGLKHSYPPEYSFKGTLWLRG